MKPWEYDYSVHPIPWREENYKEFKKPGKKLKIGILRSDGVVDPSPACARALQIVVDELDEDGCEVFDIDPPSPYQGLVLASQLLNADGCKTFNSFFRTGEWMDSGAAQMNFLMSVWRPVKWLYWAWVKYVRRDDVWAGLIGEWREKTVEEQWKLVARWFVT